MTFQKKITSFAASLAILLLAACAPAQTGVPVTGQTPSASETPFTSQTPSVNPATSASETLSASQTLVGNETPLANQTQPAGTPVGSALPPQVVLDAQQWLATQLGLATQQVQIVDVEQVQWPDSCLGLGRPNESCAAVVTPGWKAVFSVNGTTYEVRTDETGSTIRLAGTGGTPAAHTELENMFWSLVSLGPQNAQQQVAPGSKVSLLLSNGLAGGVGGCNAYGGSYQINGDQITFSDINSTLIACTDNQITEQEKQYFEALRSATSYEVNGNTLHIMYDNGQSMLVFENPIQALPTATP